LQQLERFSITEIDIEPYHRKLKNTAPGNDNIPAWVFRMCSFELAGIIAFIINYSFRFGTVPSNWLTAIVTHVPKVSKPLSLSEFRPISVTPILSRIAEKLLVAHWIRPAFTDIDIRDQFAFRPTGSTDCALIYCIDNITKMLETNNYVRCLMIDFAKAFDTVDHVIVLRKMIGLNLPASIKNRIINFFTGRSQITKVFDELSFSRRINRSIVQGSGIGPCMYVLMESDLRALSESNILFKFADDTNLLVPENCEVSLQDEFAHVQDWASQNKMIINFAKTKEIVFRRPHPSRFYVLPSFSHIELVNDAKLLGIIFSSSLSFEKHLNYVLACCSKRFYLLKSLCDGGMPISKLNDIFVIIMLVRRFCKCSVAVKCVLFKWFCLCLYDAALWSKYLVGKLNKLRSYYNKCIKIFLGYRRNYSMTQVLTDTGLPCFDDVLAKYAFNFHIQWSVCNNRIIRYLQRIWC
jgi:hypothetical protein